MVTVLHEFPLDLARQWGADICVWLMPLLYLWACVVCMGYFNMNGVTVVLLHVYVYGMHSFIIWESDVFDFYFDILKLLVLVVLHFILFG